MNCVYSSTASGGIFTFAFSVISDMDASSWRGRVSQAPRSGSWSERHREGVAGPGRGRHLGLAEGDPAATWAACAPDGFGSEKQRFARGNPDPHDAGQSAA